MYIKYNTTPFKVNIAQRLALSAGCNVISKYISPSNLAEVCIHVDFQLFSVTCKNKTHFNCNLIKTPEELKIDFCQTAVKQTDFGIWDKNLCVTKRQ